MTMYVFSSMNILGLSHNNYYQHRLLLHDKVITEALWNVLPESLYTQT